MTSAPTARGLKGKKYTDSDGKPVSGTALFQQYARKFCDFDLAALQDVFASATVDIFMKETWRKAWEPAFSYLEGLDLRVMRTSIDAMLPAIGEEVKAVMMMHWQNYDLYDNEICQTIRDSTTHTVELVKAVFDNAENMLLFDVFPVVMSTNAAHGPCMTRIVTAAGGDMAEFLAGAS